MTLPQGYRIVQIPTIMIDRPPASKPSNNLGPGFLASLDVHLQPGRLETTNDNRIRVVPEPDRAGRFSLSDDPWYRLLQSQVHERIFPIFYINQPPCLQELDRLLRRENCFHKIIRRNPEPLRTGPTE